MHNTVISLGDTPRGARVYLQGKYLIKSGFEPKAAYSVEIEQDRLTIRACDTGSRRVSAKKNGTIPVIDVQSVALQQAFANITKLQVVARDNTITITPAHTAQMIANRRLSRTEGSLFSGGGLMTQAAAELGFEPKFAVELEPKFAEIYSANFPSADMFNCSVEEVPWETLRSYAPLGLFCCGIPCEAFAQCRSVDRGTQKKRDRSVPPEAHETGDLTVFALRAIEATNAHTVVVEESPNYLKSGAGFILQNALRRLGYHVDARIVSPLDHGELQVRKRAIIVARTDAPVQWAAPVPQTRTIREILDPPQLVEGEWFDRNSKPWIFEHWERQTSRGNGFASHIVTADSPSVAALKKRYLSGQGDSPILQHPRRDGVYRFFTLNELKRLMGVPESYQLGDAKTIAGEALCQGVVVSTLREVIALNTGLKAANTLSLLPNTISETRDEAEGQLELFCFSPVMAEQNQAYLF
jgi:site-specific DNA-cytosine methylase